MEKNSQKTNSEVHPFFKHFEKNTRKMRYSEFSDSAETDDVNSRRLTLDDSDRDVLDLLGVPYNPQ